MELMDDILQAGQYIYTEDLKKLRDCKPQMQNPWPPQLSGVYTPLMLPAWTHFLRDHPDQEFVGYLLDGIANGFRIGFDYTGWP